MVSMFDGQLHEYNEYSIEDILCVECRHILTEPVSLQCGHNLCKRHLYLIDTSYTCPAEDCGECTPKEQIRVNPSKRREIQNLTYSYSNERSYTSMPTKDLRPNTKETMRQNDAEHMSRYMSVLAELQRLQNELETEIKRETENLKKELRNCRNNQNSMKKCMAQNGENIINIKRRLEDVPSKDMHEKVERELKIVQDSIETINARITSVADNANLNRGGTGNREIEKQINLLEIRITELDLRFSLLETARYDGTLLWKIKGYSRRKGEAISNRTLSLYSQPFYTSHSGYKMCARAYLNGDGPAKGKYLSLFFVIMKGEYDALLDWPFSLRTSLAVMDQSGAKSHITKSFSPDATSSSFKRPASDMNVPSGIPCFVKHEDLEKQSYVKDDCLFLMVKVDCGHLVHI